MSDEQIMTAVRLVLTPETLGEGFHTAFRKGCEDGHHVHRAIAALDDQEWHAAMQWFAIGLQQYIEDEVARLAPAPTAGHEEDG